ncbi:MAG TPA: hypothetical protein DHU55_00360 [Blastocatellia bacterium]|nr:hypothetical protein [Blastocatellia bacterium]HCX28221.1 hypothetical protein [Blastocatellia bacterium]
MPTWAGNDFDRSKNWPLIYADKRGSEQIKIGSSLTRSLSFARPANLIWLFRSAFIRANPRLIFLTSN